MSNLKHIRKYNVDSLAEISKELKITSIQGILSHRGKDEGHQNHE